MIPFSLVAASDADRGIGGEGDLPGKLPSDMAYFRRLTQETVAPDTRNAVIMGRKTWESLPVKPLPDRRNIVLSSGPIEDVESYNSIEQCIKTLYEDAVKKIFVIGGAQIYRHFIHQSDALHITLINADTNGIDTYFPVPILTIQNEFNKVGEYPLGRNALYTHWIKNNFSESS